MEEEFTIGKGCPNCKRPLEQGSRPYNLGFNYTNLLNPVYRCKQCHFVFSWNDTAVDTELKLMYS